MLLPPARPDGFITQRDCSSVLAACYLIDCSQAVTRQSKRHFARSEAATTNQPRASPWESVNAMHSPTRCLMLVAGLSAWSASLCPAAPRAPDSQAAADRSNASDAPPADLHRHCPRRQRQAARRRAGVGDESIRRHTAEANCQRRDGIQAAAPLIPPAVTGWSFMQRPASPSRHCRSRLISAAMCVRKRLSDPKSPCPNPVSSVCSIFA